MHEKRDYFYAKSCSLEPGINGYQRSQRDMPEAGHKLRYALRRVSNHVYEDTQSTGKR